MVVLRVVDLHPLLMGFEAASMYEEFLSSDRQIHYLIGQGTSFLFSISLKIFTNQLV